MKGKCACRHCNESFFISEECEEVQTLIDEREDGVMVVEIDCPHCKRPLNVRVFTEVTVDVNVIVRKKLTETDIRYIEWAKENGKDVSHYEAGL